MASTCTVRRQNQASSSELWMRTLQQREQASDHTTRLSRYTTHTQSLSKSHAHRATLSPCFSLVGVLLWACVCFILFVCVLNCNPIISVCTQETEIPGGNRVQLDGECVQLQYTCMCRCVHVCASVLSKMRFFLLCV